MAIKRRHSIKLDKAEVTSNGYLRVPAFLTRVGVFKYRKEDGSTIRELRHPDDVFNADSIATLKSVALTDDHPSEKILDSSNTKKNVVGWIGDLVQPVDIYLQSEVTIFDNDAISKIESGDKVELSCGYKCDLIEESGTFMGEPYDLRQKNIVYNHVSLVKKGRAGQNVRLHLDSEEAELVDESTQPLTEENMKKILINGVEFEVSEALAAAIEGMQKGQEAMDGMKQQLDASNEKLKGMVPAKEKADAEAKADAAQAKADSLEAQLKAKTDSEDPKKFQESVKARVALEKVASVVLKADTKLDDMSDLEIKKQVILAKEPTAKLDGQSDVYITARFDSVAERMGEEITAFERFGRKVIARNDGDDVPDSTKAREKMIQENLEAWKK